MGLMIGVLLTSMIAQGLNPLPIITEPGVQVENFDYWEPVPSEGIKDWVDPWAEGLPDSSGSYAKLIDQKYRAARLMMTSA